jgi:hypothetical protein
VGRRFAMLGQREMPDPRDQRRERSLIKQRVLCPALINK